MIDISHLCFQANLRELPGVGWVRHLRVWRYDRQPGISWDELQEVKNIAIGPDARMIEIYPPADRVVNDENMRHLWEISPDIRLPDLFVYEGL